MSIRIKDIEPGKPVVFEPTSWHNIAGRPLFKTRYMEYRLKKSIPKDAFLEAYDALNAGDWVKVLDNILEKQKDGSKPVHTDYDNFEVRVIFGWIVYFYHYTQAVYKALKSRAK